MKIYWDRLVKLSNDPLLRYSCAHSRGYIIASLRRFRNYRRRELKKRKI